MYYLRHTVRMGAKQVVRRFSLKTKDPTIAKFLALQIRARTEMIDLKNLKKFDVTFDENNNIKSLKVTDSTDAANLNEFLKLQELHRAEAHKRELERLRAEHERQEAKQKQEKVNELALSVRGQEIVALYEKLDAKLLKKEQQPRAPSLEDMKKSYLDNLTVGPGTVYKYNNFISKLIAYASNVQVYTIDKLDRKFVYSYLLHLRKAENKDDGTIKNIFNTLSTFYNHLIRTGEISTPNPFVDHKLSVEEAEREPFTIDELRKIFNNEEVRSNQKLFYVSLLLLTTGARPNEICQLWTDDIQKEGDFYTIRITADDKRDQSLKTKGSKRLIYLNQLLVRLGFLEYFHGKNLGQLFGLKKPKSKTYSTFISEDFTKILRQSGIENKTMYCFRHTAIDRMKQSLVVPQSVNQDMVGHEGTGTNELVYQQAHSPQNLRKVTEEILMYREVFDDLLQNGHRNKPGDV